MDTMSPACLVLRIMTISPGHHFIVDADMVKYVGLTLKAEYYPLYRGQKAIASNTMPTQEHTLYITLQYT